MMINKFTLQNLENLNGYVIDESAIDSRIHKMQSKFFNYNIYFILDEMVMNGYIVETNKQCILAPIKLMDKLGN